MANSTTIKVFYSQDDYKWHIQNWDIKIHTTFSSRKEAIVIAKFLSEEYWLDITIYNRFWEIDKVIIKI